MKLKSETRTKTKQTEKLQATQSRRISSFINETCCTAVPVCVQVKESQQMKVVFSEQLSKLQTKQHQDTELLEEIRYDTLSVS